MRDSGGRCLSVTHWINICWEFQGGAFQTTCTLALDFWFRETMGPGEKEGGVCLWSCIFISSHGVTGAVRSFLKSAGIPQKTKPWVGYVAYSCSTHSTNICGELAACQPAICARNWNIKAQKIRSLPLGFCKFNRGLIELCPWPSRDWQLLVNSLEAGVGWSMWMNFGLGTKMNVWSKLIVSSKTFCLITNLLSLHSAFQHIEVGCLMGLWMHRSTWSLQ